MVVRGTRGNCRAAERRMPGKRDAARRTQARRAGQAERGSSALRQGVGPHLPDEPLLVPAVAPMLVAACVGALVEERADVAPDGRLDALQFW